MPDSLREKFSSAARSHAYIGSIVVDPDYKGNGLMGVLLSHSLRAAKLRGDTDIHARVKTGNDTCLHNFCDKFNFTVVMTGQSPATAAPRRVHFLHREL